MAQQIINNGETGLAVRNKINGNFTELYTDKLTPAQKTSLTGGANSTDHFHDADRARANHTGTQTASTILDFDTEVSNNTTVVSHDADLDGMLDEPVTSLVSTTWTLDTENLRSKDHQITSADATAKTIALSNVNATADRVVVGIHAIFTTACAVTYPSGTTFVDGAPTFANGEEWLIALISHDNGTSWNGLYRQLA